MTTGDRGSARGAAPTDEVRAALARFREAKGAGERAAFWSSCGAELGEAVAGALAEAVAERVHEAVERTAVSDDELAVRALQRALRDRACLERARVALASAPLASHLAALDERLAEHRAIVDLLDDDDYLDAIGDEPVIDRTWWGRRMALIRALPMDALVHHLRRAAPRREEGATRPRRRLRDLFTELAAWSADAADRLAAASAVRDAAGAPPQFEYLPVARRARFGHRTMDAWLARVDGRLHLRLVCAGGVPDAPALVLPDGSPRQLAPADVDAIFRLPITRMIPELAQGDWLAAGAYDGALAEGFSLRGREASVDLRVEDAAPDGATEADEQAFEALSCAHDGRWTQLVLAVSRIDAAPDEGLRSAVAIHLAGLAASADLARRTRAYLTPDVWERLADRPWLGAPLRSALRSA